MDVNAKSSKVIPFKGGSTQIHFYETVSSTMDIARQKALEHCQDHTIIIADHQTAGRGRMQRNWQSDEGGLYMTWILRPTVDPSFCFGYTFSAALAIIAVLKQTYTINALVKWPNDVLVNGQKIAGILTETQIENNQLNYLNIGMGININNILKSKDFQAITLQDILQNSVNPTPFIDQLVDELYFRFTHMTPDNILKEWKANNCTIGKQVKVVTPKSTIQGLAIDVDQRGALLVEKRTGNIKTVLYGDCFEMNTSKPSCPFVA
ncbi:MAG: biotin--[acetyl-CoA-carboxylase] ligase [Candidatus Magnetomorum sp.]|nr:biotin--[acetyl-CoA-carboxylase] ligase [Candidatus Magnetomorum sp.]